MMLLCYRQNIILFNNNKQYIVIRAYSIDKSSVLSITLPVIHGSQNRITLNDVAVGLRNNLLLKGAFHTYKTKDNESNEELEDEQADY